MLVDQRLFENYERASTYIKTIGVFVNGLSIRSPFYCLRIGDVVQLQRHSAYFLYRARAYKALRRYRFKIKYRVFRLIRHKVNPNKQSAKNIPKWITKFSYYRSSAAMHVESDYQLLMFVCVAFPSRYRAVTHESELPLTTYQPRVYN